VLEGLPRGGQKSGLTWTGEQLQKKQQKNQQAREQGPRRLTLIGFRGGGGAVHMHTKERPRLLTSAVCHAQCPRTSIPIAPSRAILGKRAEVTIVSHFVIKMASQQISTLTLWYTTGQRAIIPHTRTAGVHLRRGAEAGQCRPIVLVRVRESVMIRGK